MAAGASELEWVCVDELLEAASSQLAVGEMVQCEMFSLFEAMSAVEVGNPKMDAGASSQHLDTPEDFVAKGTAPLALSPAQQLAVMERLLVLEASHYCMAMPLAATVYTSVYMMLEGSRLTPTAPLLAAFCEGLQQSCTAVRWLVFNGSVTEEEDFNLLVTGLPCEAGVPPGGAAPPPTSCLATLSAAIQSAQQQASTLQGEEAATYSAIAARLTFRRELHSALLELQHKTASSLSACQGHCTAAVAALASFTSAPVTHEQLDAAPGFVEGLNRHLLGPAPPRSLTVPSRADAWAALKAMLQHMQEATRITDATGFREVRQFVEHFSGLRAGVVARSAMHFLVAGKVWAASLPPPQPQPGGPAANGTGQHKQEAQGAARAEATTSPPWSLDRPLICDALALPTSPSLGEEVELFLEQAAIAVGNWAQAMLLNPCRQRRRLRRGLEDWANLYQHALNADLSATFGAWMTKAGWQWVAGQAGPVHPETGELDLQGPLATWVVVGMCDLQLMHLLLGWELELYGPHEYCCLYYYVQHLLGIKRTSLQLLHQVQAPAGGKIPMQLPAKPAKGGKGKAAAPVPAPISPATVRRQAGLMADLVCTEIANHLCLGMTRLMLSLEHAGLVQAPPLIFNTLRERFDQRFGSFHAPNIIRPEPLSLETYQDAIRTDGITVSDLLNLAAQSFNQVRRDYAALKQQLGRQPAQPLAESLSREQLAWVAAVDKLAATNMLAAMVLDKAMGAAEADAGAGERTAAPLTVAYDFSLHAYWPTLKVKSQAAPASKA